MQGRSRLDADRWTFLWAPSLWHAANGLQPNKFPAVLSFLSEERKVTLICRLKKFSENRPWKDKCFPKNPRVLKTELVTNLFWHNYKPLIHFLTPFCSADCAMVSECLFSNEKRLSLLSQVSVCADYNCRGLFRWRGKWPAGHSGDHSPDGCL